MKQIRIKINLKDGSVKTLDSVTLYEGEQYSTKILVSFYNGFIRPEDQLYIEFYDKDGTPIVYNMTIEENNAVVLLPRTALKRGKLKYTISKYNDTFNELEKFYPEPLFVSVALDVSFDSLDSRPDVFADINRRLLELENKLK
jgi:hypothetical protein